MFSTASDTDLVLKSIPTFHKPDMTQELVVEGSASDFGTPSSYKLSPSAFNLGKTSLPKA